MRAKKRVSRPFVRSGRSIWGTWPQPSSTICSASRQPALDVAAEAGRDQLVVRAPDEQRRRLERGHAREQPVAAERLVEVDRARAGEEREPRPGRAVDALELVDRDVGDARVDEIAVGEHRPELLLDAAAAERVGQQAELGADEAHERLEAAAHEGQRRAQQREAADPRRLAQPDLDRHPAAHRVADDVRALDLQRVHHAEHRAGEEARVVAGQRGLARAPEAREVERMDPVVAAERRRGVEERRLGAAEAVQQQDVGPLADRQGRDPVAALLDVVDAQQRRAAVGKAEHALEADRQVEVAAGVEAALRERLDAGEVTAPQREPGLRRRCR